MSAHLRHTLLLSTLHSAHARRSGYQLLAEYIAGGKFLSTLRRDPASPLPLFCARVARQFAFSRWYLSGCAELEWRAWKKLRAGFEGVIHSMWADHDLGYLDLLLDRKRHRLCGTFHNCTDTLKQMIHFPRRLRKFDAIILMSETQRPFFIEAGVAPEKIHVVLHGADTRFFEPAVEEPNEKEFVVLSVGGHLRNFPLLRTVCERMKMDNTVRFEILAPTKWCEMFTDLPNVKFFSGLGDVELLQKYQSASCLLHTAENATANNAVLEALACGIPVIAERVGGIPEYVNSNCAMLAPHGDENALVEAIRSLAASREKQKSMRIAARARAEELDWNLVAERMKAIYCSL